MRTELSIVMDPMMLFPYFREPAGRSAQSVIFTSTGGRHNHRRA
jgi:hypothetical protein